MYAPTGTTIASSHAEAGTIQLYPSQAIPVGIGRDGGELVVLSENGSSVHAGSTREARIWRTESDPSLANLLAQLRGQLPSYMLSGDRSLMDSPPKNVNGKLNGREIPSHCQFQLAASSRRPSDSRHLPVPGV